jgi:hypothetical protein
LPTAVGPATTVRDWIVRPLTIALKLVHGADADSRLRDLLAQPPDVSVVRCDDDEILRLERALTILVAP